jgi:type IV pilus assembly protein PilA
MAAREHSLNSERRHDRSLHTMRKLKRGFTLIELMIVVAIIGILAAIAIPNFIKFQARSKQSEVKSNLKALFTAERSYYQDHDTYSGCVRTIGFSPERGNRYRYNIGTTVRTDETCNSAETRATAAGVTASTDSIIAADEFKWGTGATTVGGLADAAEPAPVYAPVQPANTSIAVAANLVGVTPALRSPNGSFGGAAHGTIDNDDALDLWYISSVASTTAGICPVLAGDDMNVPGGEPKNTYNDVNCP